MFCLVWVEAYPRSFLSLRYLSITGIWIFCFRDSSLQLRNADFKMSYDIASIYSFVASCIISSNDNVFSSAHVWMSEGRLEETLGLHRRVTHDGTMLMEEPCFLVLTILIPKPVFFSLHYPAAYSKVSPIMICLSFTLALPWKERMLFIPRERIAITI